MNFGFISIFSFMTNLAPEPLILLILGLAMILFTVVLRRLINLDSKQEVHLTESGN